MAHGTCKFKKQIGGRGSYAYVALETEPGHDGVQVNADAVANVPASFVAAAITGVHFVLDHLWQRDKSPFDQGVRITEINYNLVDASTMPFVYAGAQAMCDAVGITIEIPIKMDRDTNKHYFCFPV